jgi:hypothetical protein
MTNRKRIMISVACAGVLACGGVVAGLTVSGSTHPATRGHRASLAASSCGGPKGAAYVADPAFQGFTAVDTANCEVTQTYNVDDLPVPGDPGELNFDGSDEGIALSGTTLWFAVTGTNDVAVIDTSTRTTSAHRKK